MCPVNTSSSVEIKVSSGNSFSQYRVNQEVTASLTAGYINMWDILTHI